MTERLIAVRGATTVDTNSEEAITSRVQEMLHEIMSRNGISHDAIVSALFTATTDVNAAFPATAARGIGWGDIPLMCATEIAVPGSTPMCIRVLVHAYTERVRSEIRHVYLHGAKGLRDDLPV